MTNALRGIRVLDLTNVLAGPFACHQLAHMGADVVKVETRNGGDLARQLGADAELNKRYMGVSFLAQNPGKRSITIDFKHPSGKDVFRKLVRTADVLVENFRPGVMKRLGLGYEELLKENPKLIYCAISGFGQEGPLRDLPAYDQIIQGMSGVMSITGAPENAPYRVRRCCSAGGQKPRGWHVHRRLHVGGRDVDDGLGGLESPGRRTRTQADGQ
jgi:crotonobetainyl-CoA:carnitine CoA-transferase CaiB-like acyl-CoA transferase